jgi:cyclic-di-GMP phosphodiesterase, flagellum assembly factor TipF
MAGLTGIKSLGMTGGAALAGGATGAAVLAIAGAPAMAAGLGGLSLAGCAIMIVRLMDLRTDRTRLARSVDALQTDIIALTEQQARSDARMAELERLSIESPALVWRAATADIEVLGRLVSDLARNVAEHEQRLPAASTGEITTVQSQAFASVSSPAWFEDEAELGFTAEPPMVPESFEAPSSAVMAELKSTLASALASDRLELCLQPIVALPQRKTWGYEATLRLKGESGDLQSDADLRRIAAATGLEHELDRVLVDRAVHVLRILRARNREVSLVCGIASSSLASTGFTDMMERLTRLDSGLSGALILEIGDAQMRALNDEARGALTKLSARGIGFGLCRLPHLRLDMADMASRGIRQVRVSARMLIEATQDEATGSDIHPADLAEYLQRRGIELLVCDVATEQNVLDLLDNAPPLATGALFGAARAVRPEVLEPKAIAAQETRAAARQKAVEAQANNPPAAGQDVLRGQRQTFRSLLRRA